MECQLYYHRSLSVSKKRQAPCDFSDLRAVKRPYVPSCPWQNSTWQNSKIDLISNMDCETGAATCKTIQQTEPHLCASFQDSLFSNPMEQTEMGYCTAHVDGIPSPRSACPRCRAGESGHMNHLGN